MYLYFIACTVAVFHTYISSTESLKDPTVLLAIIARNEEHNLPTFFAYIEQLDYPKNRISVYIQTDHNEDNTTGVLNAWSKNVKDSYHKITVSSNDGLKTYNDASTVNHWSPLRYQQMMILRQNALDKARREWADYLFFVDCDNFLLNPNTLKALISKERTIVAPMLRLFDSKSGYSNYWGGMDERGYYKRSPEYFPILRREMIGVFEVPMIHSTYLINMRVNTTDKLQYYPPLSNYNGEWDDILVFAFSAKTADVKLHIDNEEVYGKMMSPCVSTMNLVERKEHFIDTYVDYIAYHGQLQRSPNVPHSPPTIDNLGFDEVYLINLERRPDRRRYMELSLVELGMKATYFPAFDGRTLSPAKLKEMGIKPMMDFKDPFLERPLTMGEIGCFLSHWNIWNEMIEKNLDTVLVLEDDVRFEYNFKNNFREVMNDARQLVKEGLDWDLMYIGRKHMSREEESWAKFSRRIVHARYSYWTLAYVIRLSGAKKLVAGEPFSKMIPVDEYLPILFNDHRDLELMSKFEPRDLVALSAEPLLVYPTHYVGDEGYISDTELTATVDGENPEKYRLAKDFVLEPGADPLQNYKLQKESQDASDAPVADISSAAHGDL